MTIREMSETAEKSFLSKEATLSCNTRGREYPIEKCDIRTEFQRDRDRIIHSKSFRRLKHKTQVFLNPEGDHYRTRLTHTLEVSQIARTIGRGLRLNEDLIEAIALGHDLGHTPFGHAGERVLARICPHGFEHNKHSLRVVEVLEGGKGLNLTYEVRDGILNHRSSGTPATKEGLCVRHADKIAYINHDIDDAVRGGIISETEIPKDCAEVLGVGHGERINTMVVDLIKNNLEMSPEIKERSIKLRQFMFDRVYINSAAKEEEKKGEKIIEFLYDYYIHNTDKLPENDRKMLERFDLDGVVCDYIAGMSDMYATSQFMELFVPSPWKIK